MKADFSFTQHFVIDGVQNLVWSRDLYAIGDTTSVFKKAAAGDQSLAQAFSDARARAAAIELGGLGGWRLAKREEVDGVLNALDPTTVYMYFRPRTKQIPYRWVFATFDDGNEPSAVSIDGENYANTSLGRYPGGQQAGSPELNPYGVWLVKDMSAEVEEKLRPTLEPLRVYTESVDEQRLKPVSTYTVSKAESSFDFLSPAKGSAAVSATRSLNNRYFARYNLKSLPKGVLVGAEVLMAPMSWSGAPTPTIKIDMKSAAGASEQAEELWKFNESDFVGVWQPPNRARLELPEQVARNAYNVGDDLLLSFAADFNNCQFFVPELVVRFVEQENVLFGKPIP
ncbi:hypothetical protein [Rhizobium ruizarguesonis]|uniref:hypothetical protein n=1 Tax=Rhizobium ruizarguesonis TaxID=2081791 RepID=UPI0010325F02|nr:hypothetical protein [Rhizobium ruizarguesonis]TBC68718.1 hypothetical protein ELH30_31540 [Rhizobium ruizarguesonis]